MRITINIFLAALATNALAHYSSTSDFEPPPHILAIGATSNPLFKIGYLDVTLYDGWNGNPVDKTGKKDSYLALQKAIDDAYDYQLVAFFPAGIYKVSNTLKAIRKATKGAFAHACNITGSNQGEYPVIRLADDAPGFNNPDKPRPVIWFFTSRLQRPPFGMPAQDFSENEDEHWATMGFLQSIQNITIDCNGDNGNSGAIGLRFRAAQQSGIHNIKVIATGAYAGIKGMPARSSGGGSNIEVIGGQYGIYLESDAGNAIANLVLKDQTVASLYNRQFVPLAVIGFHIKQKVGAGITLQTGYNSAGGTITLYDGIIEVSSGNPAIDNSLGKNLYVRNVFVTGSDDLVIRKGRSLKGTGTWKQIREYNYNDLRTYTPYAVGTAQVESYALVDGLKSKNEIIDVLNDASAPPVDLVTRHGIAKLPSFEDPDTVILTEVCSARGDDDADDADEIQKAINQHEKIFVPKGTFRLKKTITLGSDTILIGLDRNMTRIKAHSSWKPTREVPLITTVDDADATTFLGPLCIGYQIENLAYDWFIGLDWRAGRNSIVFNVNDRYGLEGSHDLGQPHTRWRLSGNGGGRWYMWGVDNPKSDEHDGFRHLRIDHTSEPLWMYGCNLEKGKGTARAEINNSKNIRIFSVKVEGRGTVIRLNNCENVGIFSAGAMRKPPQKTHGLFEIMGRSNNIVLGNISPQKYGEKVHVAYTVLEDSDFGKCFIAYPELVSVFKRGDIDDSPWSGANAVIRPLKDKPREYNVTDIVALKGGRAEYPESTMYAYVRNLRAGLSLDMDIRKTADGDIVVIHDETTGRTCDKDWRVAEKTVAQLKTLDAAYHYDPGRKRSFPLRGKGITLPTLDEALALFARQKRPGAIVWIDTKDDENYPFDENQVLYDRLVALISKYDLWNETHIEVSSPKEAAMLKQRDSRLRIVFWARNAETVRQALSCPHYLRIGVYPRVAPAVHRQIRAAGKQLHISITRPFTPSVREIIRQVRPDSVGTYRPSELIDFLDRKQAFPSSAERP